jgi:multidrug efflux pump subunit AcrA (membrane-fusion protein)
VTVVAARNARFDSARVGVRTSLFWLCTICFVVAACAKDVPDPPNTVGPIASGQTSAAEQAPEASLELSPTQLQGIRIAPVGTYVFVTEKEAVGTIGFDEDLAIIQAEAALLGAAATFDMTTKELARAKGLTTANGGISEREVEQATADQETAAEALTAARDAVRALGKTDADIDRLMASRTLHDPGGPAPARAPAKWAVADVAESDFPLFRLGQAARITVPAYPDRVFSGTVSRIYAVLDSDTHRGKVQVAVVDPDNVLRPGMLANVAIRVRPPFEATAIPTTGVVREGDGSMTAWVTTDRRRFFQRPLRLGAEEDSRYEVLAGLRVGESVVTEGAVFLSSMLHAIPAE